MKKRSTKKCPKPQHGKVIAGWHCVGYGYRFDGTKFLAELPAVIYNKMPDIPGVIRIGKDYFICTDTNPITYRQVICCKAEAR